MIAHALTIDLEDWHQLLFRRVRGEVCAPSVTVVEATHRLLDMLDETGTKATFFVMGLLAEAYPDLVREVARRGHDRQPLAQPPAHLQDEPRGLPR
jgi:hypothetical protein